MQPVASRANQGNHNEDAPESIDDAWDRRQELDQIAQQIFNLLGQVSPKRMKVHTKELEDAENEFAQKSLAEEYGGCHAEGGTDDQRQDRTVKGAPDLGQDAELAGVRVPGPAGHE